MLNKIFKVKVYNLTKEIAQSILISRSGDACFFVFESGPICSLTDLVTSLKSMPGSTYLYHANQEKNDFANWVRETLGDDQLADELQKAKNQDQAIRNSEKRFHELKELVTHE